MIKSYKKVVLVLFIGIFVVGCDSTKIAELNEEIVTLERQMRNLEFKNENLNKDINWLEEENQNLRSELSSIRDAHRNLSDEQIVELLSDHRSFYCRGFSFENYQVRQVNNNIYDINIRYADLSSPTQYVRPRWSNGRVRLHVHNNGTYSFSSTIDGPMCISR